MIGPAGAFALTRPVRSQRCAVEATDPATFGIVVALLFGVALLAPRVSALRALRQE